MLVSEDKSSKRSKFDRVSNFTNFPVSSLLGRQRLILVHVLPVTKNVLDKE